MPPGREHCILKYVLNRWFENDEQIQGKNGEFLNIENVTREYNGKVIQCQVTNSAGSANFSFEISVTCEFSYLYHL